MLCIATACRYINCSCCHIYTEYQLTIALCVVDFVRGVTQLHNVLYVVCWSSFIIKTYNADTLSPLGEDIQVDGMNDPSDIVVCRDDRQLYVADEDDCIWRVSVDHHSDQEKWLPTESTMHTFHVDTLSVTSRRLLVTSYEPPRLHQYSTTDRQLLRVVQLPGYVKGLYHGVETTRGTFVVCHRGTIQREWQLAVSELFRFCHSVNEYKLSNFVTY